LTPNIEQKDIRWQQRFQNFDEALLHLQEALAIARPDIIQKAGLIQFFEMSFELAWNVMKDYLEDQGHVHIDSPRSAIKKAFEVGLITDGHGWLTLLENRNLTAHIYDEKKVDEIERRIRMEYLPLLQAFHEAMSAKNAKN
jgi:nucleotidyltransferase substrate binding protein (TIGR01987 family)